MQNLTRPAVRKSLVKFVLILLAISMIAHWHDVKKGFTDALTEDSFTSSHIANK